MTADTNILVRVIVRDDLAQAEIALKLLERADAVFIPLPSLCEFAWVLERTYGLSRALISASIQKIVQRGNVETDARMVSAGLRVFDEGGDFADGVIAAAGVAMGADVFVSFDRRAVACIKNIGMSAQLAAGNP
jgi:predicted nucleic-acid-binding protein